MRVQVLKDFTDDRGRKFPKGKVISVSSDLGKDLIKSKKAAKYTGEITVFETLKKKIKDSKLDIEIKE